jgi:uncharacterized protein YbaR (Trm112 family)
MGTLTFVCPATGTEVSTGLEMDSHDLESLELSKIYCPRCRQLHQMAGIPYWLSEFVTSVPTREDTRAA